MNHVVLANVRIHRGRRWKAVYWIHQARDVVLTLAGCRLRLDTSYGRGFDALPTEVHAELAPSFARSRDEDELCQCLAVATTALVQESPPERQRQVREILNELVSLKWSGSLPE